MRGKDTVSYTHLDVYKRQREDIDRERAFITWSTCPQPALDAVRAVCREEGHFDELLETQAGCTICNHCGPNTLGVLFVGKG